MGKVFSALAVSVDGYISGRDSGPDRGLGDAGMLFDWYFNGDTPSEVFDGFTLSEPSRRVFDAVASRTGATLVGRNTYDDLAGSAATAVRTPRLRWFSSATGRRPGWGAVRPSSPVGSRTQSLRLAWSAGTKMSR